MDKENDLWGPILYGPDGKMLPMGPKGKFKTKRILWK